MRTSGRDKPARQIRLAISTINATRRRDGVDIEHLERAR